MPPPPPSYHRKVPPPRYCRYRRHQLHHRYHNHRHQICPKQENFDEASGGIMEFWSINNPRVSNERRLIMMF